MLERPGAAPTCGPRTHRFVLQKKSNSLTLGGTTLTEPSNGGIVRDLESGHSYYNRPAVNLTYGLPIGSFLTAARA